MVLDRENLRRDSGYSIGNVIYLSTFSKTLAPGLRLGWIVAPPEVISKLVQLKQGVDLHTSTFVQMVGTDPNTLQPAWRSHPLTLAWSPPGAKPPAFLLFSNLRI